MAEEPERKEDQSIVHDDIFGQDFSAVDPSEGLSRFKIRSEVIANIPGLVSHWEGDIKKRRREILEVKGGSFVNRAISLIGKVAKNASPAVTGEEIAKHHDVKQTAKLVEALKRNPTDYNARIELVKSVEAIGKDLEMEAYRDIMLQATVANTFGMFSVLGIKTALKAQITYLNKLQGKCNFDLERLRYKNQGGKEHTKQENLIITNMRVLADYMMHANKGMDISKLKFKGYLSYREIKKAEGPKATEQVMIKANSIIHTMRYHILLQPYAHELTSLIIKANPGNPMGYFFKGRIYMSQMVFAVRRYGAGGDVQKDKREIQELFKRVYHEYGLSVNKLTNDPKKKATEMSILFEYVTALLYFIQIATKLLSIDLPRPWLVENLKRMHALLKKNRAMNPVKISELMAQVESDMGYFNIPI